MEEDPDNASGSAAEDAQEPVSITQEPVSISIVEEPATAVDDGDDSTTSSSNSPEQAMAGLRDVVENDHRQRSSEVQEHPYDRFGIARYSVHFAP